MFDKDGDNHITVKELGTVMRSLGMSPTEGEIEMLLLAGGGDKTKLTNFDTFIAIMSKQLQQKDNSQDEMKQAFKVFDKDGTGYIGVNELRHVMTNLGEKLTEEEVNELLSEADPNSEGKINFQQFAKMLQIN